MVRTRADAGSSKGGSNNVPPSKLDIKRMVQGGMFFSPSCLKWEREVEGRFFMFVAVGGKAPRKNLNVIGSRASSDGSKGKEYSGGNHYHPRETPKWQKPITSFFIQGPAETEVSVASTSPSKLDATDTSTNEI